MEMLSALFVLLSVLAFVICVVGVVRPPLLRMRKRRHAAAAAGLAIVVCGFAIDLSPPPENEGPIGPGLLAFWLLCVGAAWGLLILLRRRGAAGLLAKLKSQAATMKAEAKRQGVDAKAAKAKHADEVRRAAEVEAERRFLRQAARGAITAEANTSAITGRSSTLTAYDDRSRANEDYHSGDEEGEYGKILRRGTDGRPLMFEYASRYGEVSERMLFEWVEYPRHIQGVCQTAGAVICFRKDRVTEWRAGTNSLLRAPKGRSRQ